MAVWLNISGDGVGAFIDSNRGTTSVLIFTNCCGGKKTARFRNIQRKTQNSSLFTIYILCPYPCASGLINFHYIESHGSILHIHSI